MIAEDLTSLIETLTRFRHLLPAVQAAGLEIRNALVNGRKLLSAGNGGSAADALHLAEELVGRFAKERRPFPAIALCADPTLLTCISNDYGFDHVFSRQVEGHAAPGDVLVVFSTSGRSRNLTQAVAAARGRQIKTIALLGKDGGEIRGLVDHEIIVPSDDTARIQEVHTFVLHSWLKQLEAGL